MGLFGRNKKEKKTPCCCGGSCTQENMAQAEAAKGTGGVKVLGSGCAKCNADVYKRQAVYCTGRIRRCTPSRPGHNRSFRAG